MAYAPNRHQFTAVGQQFVIDSEYEYVKDLGQGAYGCVIAARHRRSGEGCAIKKITNINSKVRFHINVSLYYATYVLIAENPYETMPARNPVRIFARFKVHGF